MGLEWPLDPRSIERESSRSMDSSSRVLTSLLEINRERQRERERERERERGRRERERRDRERERERERGGRLRLECITGLTGGGIALPLT